MFLHNIGASLQVFNGVDFFWPQMEVWAPPQATVILGMVKDTVDTVDGSAIRLINQLRLVVYAITPLKINMEHNHGGLEDHCPF